VVPRDGADVMKKQPKSRSKKPSLSTPPKDLTGKRFGKWVVQKYAGEKTIIVCGFVVVTAEYIIMFLRAASSIILPHNACVALG